MVEIGKYKMVTLTYDLRVDDENGEMIEQATVESPLQFLYGAGLMLPKFEKHLAGLKQDDPFKIKLDSVDAYGDVNNEAIVELPKSVFLVNGEFDNELISVGNTVPMMSSNGQRLNGIVLEVEDEIIKMDFNHPLAGEDLFFTGKVIEVREASDAEVAEILSGGSSCGCGSHDHGDGCGGGSCGSEGGGCGCGC